jgi:hypothetical protein
MVGVRGVCEKQSFARISWIAIAVIIGPSVNIRIAVNYCDPNICIEVPSILQRGPPISGHGFARDPSADPSPARSPRRCRRSPPRLPSPRSPMKSSLSTAGRNRSSGATTSSCPRGTAGRRTPLHGLVVHVRVRPGAAQHVRIPRAIFQCRFWAGERFLKPTPSAGPLATAFWIPALLLCIPAHRGGAAPPKQRSTYLQVATITNPLNAVTATACLPRQLSSNQHRLCLEAASCFQSLLRRLGSKQGLSSTCLLACSDHCCATLPIS